MNFKYKKRWSNKEHKVNCPTLYVGADSIGVYDGTQFSRFHLFFILDSYPVHTFIYMFVSEKSAQKIRPQKRAHVLVGAIRINFLM